MKKLLWLISLLISASLVLGACAPAAATPEQIVITQIIEGTPVEIIITATPGPTEAPPAEPKVLRTNLGPGDVPTLDPAMAEDNNSFQIIEESFIPLVRLDEETRDLIPGIAERWDISADRLTYTFYLREDVPWVQFDAVAEEVQQVLDCEGNPRMVNANDFAYGILRTLNPVTASPYAYVLSQTLEGAAAFNNGESEDPASVGVRVVDDFTIEIQFLNDAAYNLNIASLWITAAQPQWIIDGDDCTEARSDRWMETGFFQSYGPFTLKEWVHDASLTLIRNPFWLGVDRIPQPKLDEIYFTMLDDTAAFAEYEAGSMDVTSVPLADIDRVRSDPAFENQLVIAPDLASYFYAFNTTAPHVDNVHMRRALSYAVDRAGLVENVTKGGQEPAPYFCRPGLVACPDPEDYPDLGIRFDPDKAREEFQAYLDEAGLTAEDVENQITLLYNTSSGNERIAVAIQQMWLDTLGITVQLTQQEFRVFLDTIDGPQAPQIYRAGWNMDYPDANNFLREVLGSGGNYNRIDASGNPSGGIQWFNQEYEDLVAEAAIEPDTQKRTELYAQAEQIAVVEDAVIIPLYWYTRVSVTKPEVMRTFSGIGVQHFEKWDLQQ